MISKLSKVLFDSESMPADKDWIQEAAKEIASELEKINTVARPTALRITATFTAYPSEA